MSNHDLKPLDHSNTVMKQNSENASAVSIFPLVGTESEQVLQATQSVTSTPPPAPPQIVSGRGSSY